MSIVSGVNSVARPKSLDIAACASGVFIPIGSAIHYDINRPIVIYVSYLQIVIAANGTDLKLCPVGILIPVDISAKAASGLNNIKLAVAVEVGKILAPRSLVSLNNDFSKGKVSGAAADIIYRHHNRSGGTCVACRIPCHHG